MNTASVVLVFLLGSCFGALLTAMERRVRIQQLRMAFQANLESICDRFESGWDSEAQIRIREEHEEYPAVDGSSPETDLRGTWHVVR